MEKPQEKARSGKKKVPQPEPIVIQADAFAHMVQRIDHYLYKKWPDIFVDEGMKAFKESMEKKYNEVVHSKNLINARYLEWEKKWVDQLTKCQNEMEELSLQLRALKEQLNMLKKPWYIRLAAWLRDKDEINEQRED